MRKMLGLIFLVVAFSTHGKEIICENSNAFGDSVKLEFLGKRVARATVLRYGIQSRYFLEVLSKSRINLFFKTNSGNILKLVALKDSIELTPTADAFSVNYNSMRCHI